MFTPGTGAVPVHQGKGHRSWHVGHLLDQDGAPGVRGVGSVRMLKGRETPSAAPALGLMGWIQIPGKGQRVGSGDSLGGSFRDPHF